MSPVATRMLRIIVATVAWAAMLGGALSIANLPGDWGHSICGPWGCGPPLQPIVACHLAWLIVLMPPAAILVGGSRVPAHLVRRLGVLLCLAALLFAATVVVYQRVAWMPSANEWQREYFWQRCGFVLATSIDFPAAQILLIGMCLTTVRRARM